MCSLPPPPHNSAEPINDIGYRHPLRSKVGTQILSGSHSMPPPRAKQYGSDSRTPRQDVAVGGPPALLFLLALCGQRNTQITVQWVDAAPPRRRGALPRRLGGVFRAEHSSRDFSLGLLARRNGSMRPKRRSEHFLCCFTTVISIGLYLGFTSLSSRKQQPPTTSAQETTDDVCCGSTQSACPVSGPTACNRNGWVRPAANGCHCETDQEAPPFRTMIAPA
jgi:hypothetical protein